MAIAVESQEMVKATLAEFTGLTLAQDADRALPAADEAQVVVPDVRAVELEVALDDATKLADGVRLELRAFVSEDAGKTWRFYSSIDWRSYGPAGIKVTAPDGSTLTNPNPRIGIPALKGALVRAEVNAKQLTAASVKMSAF